jgi:RNA-editing ligase
MFQRNFCRLNFCNNINGNLILRSVCCRFPKANNIITTTSNSFTLLHLHQQIRTQFSSGGSIGGHGGSSGSPMKVEVKNFVQYTEIDLPATTRINHIRSKGFATKKHEWVAMEKVHGTNFGVYLVDEAIMKYAKRSGIMNDNENFFGYHVMTQDFTQWIRFACELIKHKYGIEHLGTVILNGELFGAKYRHPDVPKSTKVARLPNGSTQPISQVDIQEEAFPQYSPELHYFCFDVKYSIKGSQLSGSELVHAGPDGAKQYSDLQVLPYDDFLEICEQVKKRFPEFIYAKPLLRGTLDQCLTFDVENFITPLPATELGLGDYPLKNNYGEGIIIKHVLRGNSAFDANAEMSGVSTILKLRSSQFMELKHAGKAAEMRKDFREIREEAIKQNGGKIADMEITSMMTNVQKAINEQLINHVSSGRLNNVVSKYGKQVLISGEMSKEYLAMLLAKDALKDFLKDNDGPELTFSSPYALREMYNFNAYAEALNVVNEKWAELTKPQQGDE